MATEVLIGIPSGKLRTNVVYERVFVASEKLPQWKIKLDSLSQQKLPLGDFIERDGVYFLSRARGDQGIFSFKGSIAPPYSR